MCGRITQTRSAEAYAKEMGWAADDYIEHDWRPCWNIAPGMSPTVMSFFDDLHRFDPLYWGYKPPWNAENKCRVQLSTPVETVAHSLVFRDMLKSGRIIVPADGWYEWSGERGHKQPWYFRRKTGDSLFLAALTYTEPAQKALPELGFVILTAAAKGGMADIHKRRPVVLSPEDSLSWMSPDLSVDQAEQIARQMALGPEMFEWYRVSTDVNESGRNDPTMIAPIEA
jgi:putative SOS response-associated peptidase YedK